MGGYNPYAAPETTSVEEERDESPRARRVGGWFRFLASCVEVTPGLMLVAMMARSPLRERLSAGIQLAAMAVAMTIEITLAASPGMLVFGLRIARADGQRASQSSLVKKAFLVRIPNLLMVPETLALLFGRSLVPSQPDSVLPRTAWQWALFVLIWLDLLAFLPAFGRRRQTLFDRILGLAVFRRRDLSGSAVSVS